ncbi:MAG: hypothetical protein QOF45_2290 [Gaiellaceae bacterium]|jgi:hypothetical protein|nr:hypothetical protein [Gaiellaceae bacterium]
MTNRRRRWLRRLAIGISLATFAAPAAARPDEGGAGSSGAQIASLSSRAILDGALAPQQAAPVRPDDRADRFTGAQQTQFAGNAVRPDDRANRFAVSGGASRASVPSVDSSVSWDGAVTLGLGTLVLVLALGLGLGYIRRPRIAGL